MSSEVHWSGLQLKIMKISTAENSFQIKTRLSKVFLVFLLVFYGNQRQLYFLVRSAWYGSPAVSLLLLFQACRLGEDSRVDPGHACSSNGWDGNPTSGHPTQHHMLCWSFSCAEPFLNCHSSTGGTFLAAHPSGTFHTHCAFSSFAPGPLLLHTAH